MKNKNSNKYQLITILTFAAGVLYAVAFNNAYHSFAANRESRMKIYGVLAGFWLILAAINFVRARRQSKEEDN